ncbi:MAG TPA: hypothetical protein VFR01_06400 [Geobacterales bacterium]|nr:hypothetical protein [Geobacterales bacterium]
MIRVAVPYYGSLSAPPLGLARLYFVAEVDSESRSVMDVSLQVWDPKSERNLSVWLREQGIEGIICSDRNSPYQVALKKVNIWVLWQQEGEVVDLVERWARGDVRQSVAEDAELSSPLPSRQPELAIQGFFGRKLAFE